MASSAPDRSTRIVATTVTEGGYYTRADGSFDADHADIRHDAANPATPHTAFGAIVAKAQAALAA